MKRNAIIVGSNGQDGRLLSDHLARKDYRLVPVGREQLDITNADEVSRLVASVGAHEIYFLAAYHHSSQDLKESDGLLFKRSFEIHVSAATNFLDAIATHASTARFFYASSSHIFPHSGGERQDETVPVEPADVYGVTKYAGMMVCRYYREKKGVFASCGILYNHESSLRDPKYLSRKVAKAAAKIARDKSGTLVLGDLDAAVDWGYAPDYVDAMHRILQLERPSDYVIATGKAHTVREFVAAAFRHVGLDYRDYVEVRAGLLTKGKETRVGDSTKLRLHTGWQPTTGFEEMVARMVDAELSN